MARALVGGFASSQILEVHDERMIRRRFDPGFRNELHLKDLGVANALGVPLPNTATCQQLFNVLGAYGADQLDHSAPAKAREIMANREVA